MTKFCPKTWPLKAYNGHSYGKVNLASYKMQELDDWRECWRNMRIASQGEKSVRRHAYNLEWLELPEHIQYHIDNGDKDQIAHAKKKAHAFYKRTPFDESLRVARSITIGSVFRLDTIYEGIPEDGIFIRQTLDDAELERGNFTRVEKFILEEELTTRFAASYVFMRDQDGFSVPAIKHYCAENIHFIEYNDDFQLSNIIFKEKIASSKRFSFDSDDVQYRELALEEGLVIERIWRTDAAGGSIDSFEFDVSADDETVITIRGEALSEIPVHILGGPMPQSPPFEALFNKVLELFSISAMIKYREYQIAHPRLHINYEGNEAESYIVPLGQARGTAFNAHETEEADEQITLVPGIALETQQTTVRNIYDTGEGLEFLFRERDRAQADLERLGGHYGITKTASNVSEGTERMRQGREAAFLTMYVMEASDHLTGIARWVAFFAGITDQTSLNEICIKLNTQLADTGPEFTFTDIRDLFVSGIIDSSIAIRMLRMLVPDGIFPDDMSNEEILQQIQDNEFADVFVDG